MDGPLGLLRYHIMVIYVMGYVKNMSEKSVYIFIKNLPFINDCQKTVCQFTDAKIQYAFLQYCLFTDMPFYTTAFLHYCQNTVQPKNMVVGSNPLIYFQIMFVKRKQNE